MNRLILLGFLFLLTKVANSQSLYNVSLKDTTVKMVYAVLSNKVELFGMPYSEEYTVSCSTGTAGSIFYEDNRCFFYINCNPGPDQIDIAVSDSGKEIYHEYFKVALFQNPKVRFANADDTLITTRQIKETPFFVIEWDGNWKTKCSITSYEITISKSHHPQKFQVKGPLLPGYLIRMISKLKQGDMILFENVRVWSGDVFRILEFPFTIKT